MFNNNSNNKNKNNSNNSNNNLFRIVFKILSVLF